MNVDIATPVRLVGEDINDITGEDEMQNIQKWQTVTDGTGQF